MPSVWNKRDPNCPEDAVYIGRPSKWGNPFRFPGVICPTRGDAIEGYRLHVTLGAGKSLPFGELRGKDLVCWCAPLPCHGDVLLELANREEKQDAQSRSNPVP